MSVGLAAPAPFLAGPEVASEAMTLADTGAAYRPELAIVRRMIPADAAWAAHLHCDALGHGFFSRLGPRFLTAYYESFVESPYAVSFIADTTSGPVGMLVGTVRNRAHYSWVLRTYGRRLFRRALASMVVRPRVLMFFLRTRLGWYLRAVVRWVTRMFTRSTATTRPSDQPAVLTHIAVDESARGSGAGAALVAAFVNDANRAGCTEAVLVTLAGPAGAGPFYRRLGWTLRDRHDDHDGRLLECYSRRL